MNKYILFASVFMVASVSSIFAQLPTDQDVLNGIKRVVGTKTSKERNDYKEAKKEVKQIEKKVEKQEATTEKVCTPSVTKTVKTLVNNPVEAAKDLSNNRNIGASQCDRENEKLNALKIEEADAERIAREKKAAYEDAKKRTGSWR